MKEIIERFVNYAKIDTQSDPNSDTIPSTKKQFDLANLLVSELKDFGLKDVEITDECYIYATIPSNSKLEVPKIGFVAHMDTSPDNSGKNVKPQVHVNYQGGDIYLGKVRNQETGLEEDIYIKQEDNLNLEDCLEHTIITTDGKTLLGSDDKSGVTAIMEMARILTSNDKIKHGAIGIAFTPDEEIGRGADKFNIEKFACEYAYTIDGEMPEQINKETFSADHAFITVHGRDIHPGSAKGIMVNSGRVLSDIISKLPPEMSPETTEGHQPYIHPHNFKGSVIKSEVMLLFRAFDDEGLIKQKHIVQSIIDEVSENYPKAKIQYKVEKIYRNMLDELSKNPKGCDYLFEAAENAGVNPVWESIRGGTDGSILTEMGLPCPNIFTGGNNFHSVKEWLSVNSLQKTIETMINLVQIWEQKS